ncbi:hypothetical protein ACQP2F_12315 [Actinoplanes sp. CA-030573]|uniref:hypothetical protein n=1 Tax=Actinoplanes sp. CA-030573 TaxID=3239898 RepID=UPI003D8F96B9
MTKTAVRRTRSRGDLVAAGAAAALVLIAAVVAVLLQVAGNPVHAGAAPLFARWLPHAGPGTAPAVAVAVMAGRYGFELAKRLRWRAMLAASYATAFTWTLSLALVDGWQRGVAGRLTTRPEYLTEVPGVTDIPAMLRGFGGRILDFQPDSWTTHVAGHPPGALLVFVALDRLGLGGGAPAGLVCIAIAALTAVAVPVTVRLLASEEAARTSAPFVALFPGAVWAGVSADGLFAGVTASGVALLAYGVVRRAKQAAFAGGLLLGAGAYLSYGLVLMAALVAAVMLIAPGGRRTAFWALAGAAVVVAAFSAAGFDWLTGYHLVSRRYYQGLAAHRPYAYWVWADLAALAIAAGPAAAAILRRAAQPAAAATRPALAALRRRTTPPAAETGRPALTAIRHGTTPPAAETGCPALTAIRHGTTPPAAETGRPAAAIPHLAEPPARTSIAAGPRTVAGTSTAKRSTEPPGTKAPSARRPSAERRGAEGPAATRTGVWLPPLAAAGVWLLPLAAAGAILAADLSGYSKAEVERIWLPFAWWVMAGAALLPERTRRPWLIAQMTVALIVNHLLLTVW